jgi:hypothetical protein
MMIRLIDRLRCLEARSRSISAPRGLLRKSPNVIICGDTILERLGGQLAVAGMGGRERAGRAANRPTRCHVLTAWRRPSGGHPRR